MKNIKNRIISFYSPWGEEQIYRLVPVKECYQRNKRLAVTLFDLDTAEEFAKITVNLPQASTSGENCSFVDTNNCSWAEKLLTDSELAKPTKCVARSGYCIYPEYKFDVSKLLETEDLIDYFKNYRNVDMEM